MFHKSNMLLQLCKLVEGGTEALLNHLWSSQIKSYEDIRTHLRFSDLSPPVARELSLSLTRHSIGFEQLLANFLQGKGIPSIAHFEQAKPHFSTAVDLNGIDNQNFRPRMFCWAITGSPTIDVGSPGILVCYCITLTFICTSNSMYDCRLHYVEKMMTTTYHSILRHKGL